MELRLVESLLYSAYGGCEASKGVLDAILPDVLCPKLQELVEIGCPVSRKYHPLFETIANQGDFSQQTIPHYQKHISDFSERLGDCF